MDLPPKPGKVNADFRTDESRRTGDEEFHEGRAFGAVKGGKVKSKR
jgi:hypothetical protein